VPVRATARCTFKQWLANAEAVGARFSGTYYLTSVEHAFRPGQGYRTHFSARRNAT
jgi:hypothetical protein